MAVDHARARVLAAYQEGCIQFDVERSVELIAMLTSWTLGRQPRPAEALPPSTSWAEMAARLKVVGRTAAMAREQREALPPEIAEGMADWATLIEGAE